MTYSTSPTRTFLVKKNAAEFLNMNPSTFSKKLKAASGELYVEGFYVSDRNGEICVFEEVQPLAKPAEEVVADGEAYGAPYQVDDVDYYSRKDAAAAACCSVGRIGELVRASRDRGQFGFGKTVRGSWIFVSHVAEDFHRNLAETERAESKSVSDASKAEKLREKAEKLAAKVLKAKSDLQVVVDKINTLDGTSFTTEDFLA